MAALRSPLPLLLQRPAAAAPPLRRRPLLLASCARPRRTPRFVPRCSAPPPPSTLGSSPRGKCSPLLQSALLPGGSELAVHEWKAVPDIWRTAAAEKYSDRVALVDPYHDPHTHLERLKKRLSS